MNINLDKIKNYNFFSKIKALDFVEELWLYGSRVRGDNQERADIDLAIKISQKTVSNWNKILEIIDEADTLLSIDCVNLQELPESSSLRKAILNEGIKLYDKYKN